MVKSALIVALLASCVRGDYRCATDSDCDVGTGGRCELDQRCTVADATCALGRRYADLAGATANQCFDNAHEPLNPCVAGQPPTTRTGCYASVCERLPSCCDTGWSEPCVQLAQLHCESTCQTDLAVTVERNDNGFSLALLHPRGDEWQTEGVAGSRFVEWLPPITGDTRPRLAHLAENGVDVVIDGVTLAQSTIEGGDVPAGTVNYRGVAAIDLDRSGRNHVLVTRQQPQARTVLELSLDEGGGFLGARDLGVGLDFLVGGDVNLDAYPDLAAWVGSAYLALAVQPPSPVSLEAPLALVLTPDTQTAGVRQTRPVAWGDFDGDHILDLVLAGTQLRTYLGTSSGLSVASLPPLDCLDLAPGYPQSGADDMPEAPCTELVIAVAALPRRDGTTELVVGTYTRVTSRVSTGTLGRYRLANDGTLERAQEVICPDCSGILGLAARDLDGDHELDIIAVDALLHLVVAKSSEAYLGRAITPSPLTLLEDTVPRDVRISASGSTP